MPIWILILLIIPYSAQALVLDKDKSLSATLSQSLSDETTSSLFDFTVRVPKKDMGVKYIPQLSLLLGHNTIALNKITRNAGHAGKNISGSMIGIRAGVSLPTRSLGRQLVLFYGGVTFARTSVQSDPWFGQPDDDLHDSHMHQADLGLHTHYKNYLLGYTYSVSDLRYLRSSQYLSLGFIF